MVQIADLDIGNDVARVPASQLTPLSFHRDYVARNKPVIVTGAVDAWPAMHRWSARYMADKMGPAEVRLHMPQSVRACPGLAAWLHGDISVFLKIQTAPTSRSQWR